MEVPVRRILQCASADNVAARDTMQNPQAVDWFIAFRATAAQKLGA